MKRFLIFVVLVILAVYAVSRWNQHRRIPETYTPAVSTQLDLKDMQVLSAIDRESTRLVQAVVPSVVSITTSRKVQVPQIIDPFEFFFGRRAQRPEQQQIQNSLGSGVIVSKEGHILTNNHVIANTDEVKVQLSDGRELPARIIGADKSTDIAVLKIDTTGIAPLPLGDSDEVKTGQVVFAIGNPFGLQETVTQGIISATGRQVSDESANEFFQTNTVINPGNSGGPLVNIRGEIIGINNAIGNYSGKGTFEGVGFAIPANVARHSLESIIKTGRVVRGYLGVSVQELNPELADQFGVSAQVGAVVNHVTPDSPAEKAGIKPGDILIAFNGKPLKNIRTLFRLLTSVPVGSKVEIDLIRDKKPEKVTAIIEEQPAGFQASITPRPEPQQSPTQPDVLAPFHPLAGIAVSAVPADQQANLPPDVNGVMVTAIDPGAPAADILQPGDVIEEISRQPIRTPEQFQQVARMIKPGRPVMLSIARGKLRSFVVISPR